MVDTINYNKIRDYIYEKTGIYIEEKRMYFFKNRVIKRIKKLALDNPETYYNFLVKSEYSEMELKKLISEITINETYFFREFPQLKVFAEYALNDVIKRKSNKYIKVLSAGSASGEEPYTLSIILKEMLDYGFDYKIDALDIDPIMVLKARSAVYSDYSIRDVPKEYLAKYFEKEGNNYKVKDIVKDKVNIYNLNLIEDETYEKLDDDYDFIFCRNVFIYFSDEIRKKIVTKFYTILNEGGYIFLGHSESINRITNAFRIVKANDFILYQKPSEGGANNV
ncbi:CheR family methyltransferase [Marinitoga aeolica]|uniref:protein-glutamate O-methyltransferase n=1 Tax=Marinitoga aeolica TaxID=2809031 RepID=A0ABY8PT89_9BACT|nr:protein-glutamate O-methyltransferase CheR [Marinitoga aeolica]WGS65861.1 protein-glutamate O-methyltransferase CheR [Marinitoga aeolica]